MLENLCNQERQRKIKRQTSEGQTIKFRSGFNFCRIHD
jgi:hypothetical protein